MWGNEVGRRISLGRCCLFLFAIQDYAYELFQDRRWFHLVIVPPPTQKNFGSKSKGFSECFQHGARWRINMEVISFHCKSWFLPQGNFNPLAILFLFVSSA
ncbi:hypothetical protein ES332_D05G093900v1 [Gossypium tomentosum]|uniref:Uncharacterized protein n=1 Tax=Gossypium tomentosum TaxID=34277 RepID=A0A5D2KT35_GOSTO|nr:hypothetical protein ES332_D05G093900v1 [Gossypium tomentosum]